MTRLLLPVLAIAIAFVACKPQTTQAPVTAPADSTASVALPRFGYVKSLEILSLLPDVKDAEKRLESYARSKESTFRSLAEKYQAGVADLQENGMLLPQSEQEKRVQELQALEGRLQQMQANSQGEIGQERERLYAPIMTKVDSIIKLVGKEQGFAMIYDGAALVYADSVYDITPLIKTRLGIVEEAPETPAKEEK
ncbi:MAG: hypothetical protein OHK0039_37000 [Bacteroidia bacterium]